jgi:hypothetical protein
MGSVAMGSSGSWYFEGYNITEYAYCLYCDKCGSFKIICWIPKWLSVIIFFLVLIVALENSWDRAFAFLGAVAILLLFLLSNPVRHLIHICKNCGNTQITRDNVLNYPEFELSVLDVSYEKTIKYYREDG